MMSLSLFALAMTCFINVLAVTIPFLINAYPASPLWQLSLAKNLISSTPNLLAGFVLIRLSSFVDPENIFYLKILKWSEKVNLVAAGLYFWLVPMQIMAAHRMSITEINNHKYLHATATPFAFYAIIAALSLASISPTWSNPRRPLLDKLFSLQDIFKFSRSERQIDDYT